MHRPKSVISAGNLKLDEGPGPSWAVVHNVDLDMPKPKKSQQYNKPKKSTKSSLFGNLFGEKPQPKFINKADISGPTDFVHIQGTKQSNEGGFSKIDNLAQIDPNLRQLFEMANINFNSLDSTQKKEIQAWADSKKNQSRIKHFGASIRQQEASRQPTGQVRKTQRTPKNGEF